MNDHHAVLYVGGDLSVVAAARPDHEWIAMQVDTLSIAEVRRLISLAYQTPGVHPYRTIAVTASAIAFEAQHALLKVLEEPPATTRFVFCLPSVAGLLPTVLSRFMVVTAAVTECSESVVFSTFLESGIVARIEQIATAAKKKDDDYFRQLEAGLHAYLLQTATTATAPLHQCLIYLGLRGASKKMLWDEIALTLPLSGAGR